MADKKSSDELASEAAKTLKDPNATEREKRLAASVLAQADGPEEPPAHRHVDPEHLAGMQKRVTERTEKLRNGEIPGRARPTAPNKPKKGNG